MDLVSRSVCLYKASEATLRPGCCVRGCEGGRHRAVLPCCSTILRESGDNWNIARALPCLLRDFLLILFEICHHSCN